jgi:hypothetical protein
VKLGIEKNSNLDEAIEIKQRNKEKKENTNRTKSLKSAHSTSLGPHSQSLTTGPFSLHHRVAHISWRTRTPWRVDPPASAPSPRNNRTPRTIVSWPPWMFSRRSRGWLLAWTLGYIRLLLFPLFSSLVKAVTKSCACVHRWPNQVVTGAPARALRRAPSCLCEQPSRLLHLR